MKKVRLRFILALIFTIGFAGGVFSITALANGPQQGLYQFENIFAGGALLYRPKGTQGLKVFDLNNSVVAVQVFEKCARITIFSSDGRINGPCVPNALLQPAQDDTD